MKLTLAGRTAQYIAARFDCSISVLLSKEDHSLWRALSRQACKTHWDGVLFFTQVSVLLKRKSTQLDILILW